MTHYSEFLYFMEDDNVPQEEKQNIQMEIAQMFSAQERSMRMDAQVFMFLTCYLKCPWGCLVKKY